MSAIPVRTASSWAEVGRSRRAIWTSGRAARKRWTIPGTIDSSAEPTKLTRSTPSRPESIARAVVAAASTPARIARASRRNAAPAGVSATRRRVRASSMTPSSASSAAICVDSGGWEMCSRAAARRKCSSSATATKYLSWRSSTVARWRCRPGHLIRKSNQSILIRYWTGSTERHTVRRNVVPAHLPQLRRARGDRLRLRGRDQSAAVGRPELP